VALVEVGAPRVQATRVAAYEIPTDEPESDGTLEWTSTTIVSAEVAGGGERGLGYTYGDVSVARLIDSLLAPAVEGVDPLATGSAWKAMHRALRNAGSVGPGAMALAAVDIALWDLKARLLDLSLADLLPRFHDRVPAYGSGGFCSYTNKRLEAQLSDWAAAGFSAVKMKVGRDPQADDGRVRTARVAVGPEVGLLVDANGAYEPKQALDWAERFAQLGVTWLEEPVSSDDLDGLRRVRRRAPAGVEVAAGEYGWDLPYFERMLSAGAVDVLQADVTRCGGITPLLELGGICAARGMPLSAHCAPAVSTHAFCAVPTLRHAEYFHDHARVESLLFDGATEPADGFLQPDRSRSGLGLELKHADAEAFAA
jgi:L-alanine-DL-glutamate epimerase-like enolase superfamily enzyme